MTLPPPHRHLPALSRRSVLLGAAGLVVLGACGGDDDSGSANGSSGNGGDGAPGPALGVFFDRNRVPTGQEVRLPFGVLAADGSPLDDVPATLEVRFRPEGGEAGEAGEPMEVARHDDGVPRPYFPVRTTFDRPGLYELVTEVDGTELTSAIMTIPPEEYGVTSVGDDLPALATPTVADARGVTPICTAEPPCPLHEISLDTALGQGRPIALLVSTPAFCQTNVCGPVLDLVLAQQPDFADRVTFVHVEVYRDPFNDLSGSTTTAAGAGDPSEGAIVAPIVEALGLTYEPALFVAGADGNVVERLDFIFDAEEIRAALRAVSG